MVGSDVHLSWRWLQGAATCGRFSWCRCSWLSILVHLQPPCRALVSSSTLWSHLISGYQRVHICVLVTSSGPAGMSLPPVGILEGAGYLCVASQQGEGQLEHEPWPWHWSWVTVDEFPPHVSVSPCEPNDGKPQGAGSAQHGHGHGWVLERSDEEGSGAAKACGTRRVQDPSLVCW